MIVDRQFLPHLLKTRRGPALRTLPFMHGMPWIRHDEHYHVVFALPWAPRKAMHKQK